MSNMNITDKIAPCGLDCSRCADYINGEIKELSSRLRQLLEGYDRLAKIKEKMHPELKDFNQFQDILKVFAQASCGGCRSNDVKCPVDCHAKTCHKDRHVDFCFQCDDFPCNNQFKGKLRERWIEKNNRMKEVGIEQYYIEELKKPRY